MDSREVNWLLKDKYGLDNVLSCPEKWPPEASQDIDRLKSGEPLAYIIGYVLFLDCHIDLRLKPLIPRVETEYWADKMIKRFRSKRKGFTCLDVFSGSGCLGLSLLKHCAHSSVDFADNADNCLEQIAINLFFNDINAKRAKIIKSDLFDQIENKYDLILANPPYLNREQMKSLPDSVKNYEPETALFGGEEGFYFINRFLVSAKKYLNPGGEIWLEFDSSQKKDIEKTVDENGYYCQFGKDQFNLWRFGKIMSFD